MRTSAAASDLFAIGMSAVKMKKIDTAHEALAQLKNHLSSSNEQSSNGHIAPVKVMAMQLEGLILGEEGKREEGMNYFRKPRAKEDERPYDYGPPVPVKPSHELLGETLLHMNRPEEAKREFETSLSNIPNRLLSNKGLQQAKTKISNLSS